MVIGETESVVHIQVVVAAGASQASRAHEAMANRAAHARMSGCRAVDNDAGFVSVVVQTYEDHVHPLVQEEEHAQGNVSSEWMRGRHLGRKQQWAVHMHEGES